MKGGGENREKKEKKEGVLAIKEYTGNVSK